MKWAGRQGFAPIRSEAKPSCDVTEDGPSRRRVSDVQGFGPARDERCESRRDARALPSSRERAERVKWLGGRDSNPDNHVQSVVSYR